MPDDLYSPEGLVERQQHPRSAVLCPAKIQSGDRQIDCEILNLSAGGAKVRVSQSFDYEPSVSITIDDFGTYPCDIVWQDGEHLGIRFPESVREQTERLQEELKTFENPKDRRRFTRNSVLWMGRIIVDERMVDCKILNISVGGAKIVVSDSFDYVGPVTLRIDRFGDFEGEIVWQAREKRGVKFLEDPQVVAQRLGHALPKRSL